MCAQNGQPPLGWYDTVAYLVLPVVLVISQFVSMQLMSPPEVNPPLLRAADAASPDLPGLGPLSFCQNPVQPVSKNVRCP